MATTPAFLLLLLSLHLTSAAARTVPPTAPSTTATSPLASRLKLNDVAAAAGGDNSTTAECLGSLVELQACSGEIILFFLNGETYLGDGCCRAIRVVAGHCWGNLIGSMGFTEEESDVLEGYCDRADDDDGDDGGDGDGGSPPPASGVHKKVNIGVAP